MLKTIRIILAILSLTAVTLLFVDVTAFAVGHWGWMARIQLIPALLAGNLLVLGILAVLTLLLGRVYCSVICPLGIFQDCIIWLKRHCVPRKKHHRLLGYQPATPRLQYAMLALFVILIFTGIYTQATPLAWLLEPYSAYGRMASQLLGPLWRGGENLLAQWSASHDNYIFLPVIQPALQWPLLAVAVVTALIVGAFALVTGRGYCNSICPVGTVLGFLSRHAWLAPVINTSKCSGCGKCARNCKSRCIDPAAHTIDYSRCVACMDCLGQCSTGAISFTRRPKSAPVKPAESTAKGSEEGLSRRTFLTMTAAGVTAMAAHAADKTTDGGLTPLKAKQRYAGEVPVLPAGARGLNLFNAHCTACQLCVNTCPEGVLVPGTESAEHFMQPQLVFTAGYCRPECNACSQVCPSGAIMPVTLEQKSSIKIGCAQVEYDMCLSAQGRHCGSCSRHCPTAAITMTETETAQGMRLIPIVDNDACIGCGSCEYHCPVGTTVSSPHKQAAIHVGGVSSQRTI